MAKKKEPTVEEVLGVAPNGDPVTAQGISMNVGSGLKKAAKVKPIPAKAGDVLYVAVRATVVGEDFDYDIDDDGDITDIMRVLQLKPTGVAFVDGNLVIEAVQAMVDQVAEWEQAQKDGQRAFEFGGDEDEVEPKPGRNATITRGAFGEVAEKVDDAMKDVKES